MLTDREWIRRASMDASRSLDPSTKVGCVVVKNDKELSFGWNCFPDKVVDTSDRWNNRDLKYKMIVHAEINAIINKNVRGATAYVTHHPCSCCMAAMIQAGIERVVTLKPEPDFESRWEESIRISKMMCEEADVDLVLLD
jgi:dCMP deaminase